MIRRALLAAADSDRLRDVAAGTPVSRDVVRRFVAGEGTEDAVEATRRLLADGLLATIDHLGEDTTDLAQAEATRTAYLSLLGRLADEGLTSGAEVSVKLSAIGQALPGDGEKIALEHARQICAAADAAGTTVTLDMEDHTTTDSTLGILARPAPRLPRHRRGPAVLPDPDRGRLRATWRTRAPGCGCARAPTTSPRRSRSRTPQRSTARTCAACAR